MSPTEFKRCFEIGYFLRYEVSHEQLMDLVAVGPCLRYVFAHMDNEVRYKLFGVSKEDSRDP
jgi:hypothetical protein